MLDPENLPDIEPNELTARFIADKRHLNRSTNPPTVKPNAYMPRKNEEGVSITRLVQITEAEIWAVGRSMAANRNPPRTLRGRSDVLVATFQSQGLEVKPVPVDDNPNHAEARGWPTLESDQLMIAKEIAAVAKFTAAPSTDA